MQAQAAEYSGYAGRFRCFRASVRKGGRRGEATLPALLLVRSLALQGQVCRKSGPSIFLYQPMLQGISETEPYQSLAGVPWG